jgi:DNA-directed RNA polymerase subunit E"
MARKVCKSCKLFYDSEECPTCHSAQTAISWKGRLHILDKEKSTIAQKIGVTVEGEYAIKVN